MKTEFLYIQLLPVENQVSTHYRLLDDGGNEIARGARQTTLTQATKDAIVAETLAQIGPDLAALVTQGVTAPDAVLQAMQKLGTAKAGEASALSRQAALQADIDQKTQAVAALDAAIATKQSEIAKVVA